jgi:hypothetical protein
MKKSEKYMLTCLVCSIVTTINLVITRDNDFFIVASIFAAAVFIIGALEK